MPVTPMRQMCAICDHPIVMDFSVPDWLWAEVVHPSRLQDIHCLQCFARRADEKMLRWHKHVEAVAFYSLVDHVGRTQSGPPSEAWLRRMSDAEAECESIAAGVSEQPAPATKLQEISDGFGGVWLKCDHPECDLHVVRPGKSDCSGYCTSPVPGEEGG